MATFDVQEEEEEEKEKEESCLYLASGSFFPYRLALPHHEGSLWPSHPFCISNSNPLRVMSSYMRKELHFELVASSGRYDSTHIYNNSRPEWLRVHDEVVQLPWS